MPPLTSRKTIRQNILYRVESPAFPLVSAATSNGTTTALNDSILAAAAQADDYVGKWIYIASKPTESASVGQISRVTNVDFSGSTSQLILSPAVDAIIKSGTEYELHRRIHPNTIHKYIKDVLDQIEHPVIIPLTQVIGGDMEGDPAIQFTGTNASLTNEVSTVLHGRKSLKVTATAANGYASPANINLPPNTEVLVAADVFITSGDSAKLIFYDITNSANIDTAASAATGWVHFAFVATTPATCEVINVRLESQGSGDIVYWDNIIVLPTRTKSYPYPSILEYHHDLTEVFYFPRGNALSASTDDNAYRLLQKESTFWSHATLERDDTAVVPYRVEVLDSPLNYPLWVKGLLDYPDFAGVDAAAKDIDTTYATKELIQELVYARILEDFRNEAVRNKEERTAIAYQTLRDEVIQNVNDEFGQFIKPQIIIIGATAV